MRLKQFSIWFSNQNQLHFLLVSSGSTGRIPETASGVTHYGETALWGLKIVSKYGSTFVTEFIEFNSAKVADELFGKRIIDTY